MKGLISRLKISENNLDRFVSMARKKGFTLIPVITPNNQSTVVVLGVSKRPKGFFMVSIDTWKSGCNITKEGQKEFIEFVKNIPDPDDRKEVDCGKRVMRVDVKETGEKIILAFMLAFLENGEFIEEVSSYSR